MDMVTAVGSVAAFCTTVAFLPQVVKVYKTKSARDLSLPMYVIFSIGVLSWLVYGILDKSLPIIIANIITFVLALYIIGMKVKYG